MYVKSQFAKFLWPPFVSDHLEFFKLGFFSFFSKGFLAQFGGIRYAVLLYSFAKFASHAQVASDTTKNRVKMREEKK